VTLVPGIAGLIVLALLASATVRRSALFDSEILLWRDAAVKSRTNARPHLQYALLLTGAGRAGEARQALSRARAIDPFSAHIEDLWRAGRPREHPP
jgi:protein O-mannosyl-transferase